MKHNPFNQNSVILTGATLGIGRQIALQLAEKGAWLVLAARNNDELKRVADLCREKGGKAIAVTTDISVESQCKALIERSINEYGRIDTLINNAGIGMQERFDQLLNLASMEMLMRVNFWGSVFCTYFALEHLKASKGRIVVINSGGGMFVTPNAIGYGASKHALAGFFNTLRIELDGSGVSITSLYPEWVDTGISSRALRSDGKFSGKINSHERGAMSPDAFATIVLRAAARRKRDIISPKLKFGLLLAPFFPGLVDRISTKSFVDIEHSK